jgi:hypothetical protein
VPAIPAPPPWRLLLRRGGRVANADNIAAHMQASGHLRVTRRGLTLEVERLTDPPPYLQSLGWRLTAAGIIGRADALREHFATWPAFPPIADPASLEPELAALDARPKPVTMFDLASALRHAEMVLAAANTADTVLRAASGVATTLLRWYPTGQMIAWGKSVDFIRHARPGHLLAALAVEGWGSALRALKAGSGGLWFSGEDFATTHPATLYLNLVNAYQVPGVALDTLPITFIFEFGEYLTDNPALDFLALRYIHSSSDVHYVAPNLTGQATAPWVGSMEQDALREWFVARFNGIGNRLTCLENYMTATGDLRPLSMQETLMTVVRMLNETARLLATQERGHQRATFWDLVDLYESTTGGSVHDLFDQRLYKKRVVASMASLPGSLATLFTTYAAELYDEWVSDVVDGVTDPSRKNQKSVSVGAGSARRRLPHAEFFKRYMAVRRNTLHGYDLHRTEAREFLAIHDGRLPVRIAEWGRLQFLALMSDPTTFLRDQRFLKR